MAGNQPAGVEDLLRNAGLNADFVASSAAWGVAKPDRGFSSRVNDEAKVPAGSILYVGDRPDNDVLPARAAGMGPASFAGAHGAISIPSNSKQWLPIYVSDSLGADGIALTAQQHLTLPCIVGFARFLRAVSCRDSGLERSGLRLGLRNRKSLSSRMHTRYRLRQVFRRG
ncbi:HAD hydrolase, REG-2-like, family IA [Mycobacteroides abscessus subsp. bolletii]|nr:HAD hydrolase, REG-2-like, family IA [Mycobacteroides abscessus subsp. bolletii]SLD78910.1 HAD hydrolase, REG-2-like, family IA [Mycobacteroides abscessus subsp. bolletii]SLD86074.1 HAD hydrolase, REG-2-like, family IA [Mycobacteroides abscessus subsp. bolletii]